MQRVLAILIGCLMLLVGSSRAGEQLTLKEVLDLAEKNNKEIRLARANLKLASAQKKEAISTALPKVNLQLNYNRNFLQNIFYFTTQDPQTGQNVTRSFKASFNNEYQMNAVLNQTIYSFGKVGNAIKAAGYFTRFTSHQYEAEWQRVITQVKKAFYQALLLKKVWEVAQQSEISALDNYNNVKLKFDNGVVSEFELLQAETRWKNAIPETMKARKNYEIAINNLKVLVDIPLRKEIELVGNLENYQPFIPDSMDYRIVFEQRPDYQALQWEKKLREKKVAVEYANHLPTLSGSLIYTYGARSDEFRLDNSNDNVILGINLSVPIFTGGYTSAQVQKARVEVEKVKIRIALANDNIRVELQNILLRMREARERITAAAKSVESARRAFEIAETRVQNGLATQLELKDSRVLLDQAQLTFFSAIYDYLNAKFDWDQATGQVRADGI